MIIHTETTIDYIDYVYSKGRCNMCGGQWVLVGYPLYHRNISMDKIFDLRQLIPKREPVTLVWCCNGLSAKGQYHTPNFARYRYILVAST
jgi:hypothetical protein